jgi:hypothetical protein
MLIAAVSAAKSSFSFVMLIFLFSIFFLVSASPHPDRRFGFKPGDDRDAVITGN